MENRREEAIRRWFAMWLEKKDRGIAELFDKDALYIESWGPAYRGADKIRHWFAEWNSRGTVLEWRILQFFHKDDQTVVEWYFQNQMNDGTVEAFDGVSLVSWTAEGRIARLKEFGCNTGLYDPYEGGPVPRFQEKEHPWF